MGSVHTPRSGTDPRLTGIHADIANDTQQTVWLARPNFRIWVTLGVPALIAFVAIFWPMVARPV